MCAACASLRVFATVCERVCVRMRPVCMCCQTPQAVALAVCGCGDKVAALTESLLDLRALCDALPRRYVLSCDAMCDATDVVLREGEAARAAGLAVRAVGMSKAMQADAEAWEAAGEQLHAYAVLLEEGLEEGGGIAAIAAIAAPLLRDADRLRARQRRGTPSG